jgi:hypothetical protein
MALGCVLALLGAAPASAQEAEGRCMERHLREAIALNRERMPRYDSLTGGRSRAVSRRLIRSEQLALAAAWVIDRRAETWLAHGVRIVCDDFVPMEHTPPFLARADPPPYPFVPRDPRRIRRAVVHAFRAGGFAGASAALEDELGRLSEAPAYHCMTRHLLESALRISNLAPVHAEAARAHGLPPTDRLSRTLLDLHLMTLGEAARLDRRAAPIQAEGVPIVCRDVPPIPPR